VEKGKGWGGEEETKMRERWGKAGNGDWPVRRGFCNREKKTYLGFRGGGFQGIGTKGLKKKTYLGVLRVEEPRWGVDDYKERGAREIPFGS